MYEKKRIIQKILYLLNISLKYIFWLIFNKIDFIDLYSVNKASLQ